MVGWCFVVVHVIVGYCIVLFLSCRCVSVVRHCVFLLFTKLYLLCIVWCGLFDCLLLFVRCALRVACCLLFVVCRVVLVVCCCSSCVACSALFVVSWLFRCLSMVVCRAFGLLCVLCFWIISHVLCFGGRRRRSLLVVGCVLLAVGCEAMVV